MKNKLFILLSLCLLSNVSAQEYKFNIVFEPGQITMGDKQKKAVNEVAARLKEAAFVIFYPLAYDSTTDIYTYSSNADKQANALSDYATTLGFKLTGIPKNFPSGYSGLSYSVVMKYYKMKDADIAQLPPAIKGTGVKGHYPEKPSQFFVINPLRDTIIIGNEGTKLFFKAGSLLTSKKVQIELKEFYQLSDYIKNGLPTVSNGKMLQTGGSIYLNAKENDATKKQVQINPQEGVGLDFTLGKNDNQMQVFIKDPRTPNEMNWILPRKRTYRESYKVTQTFLDADGKILSQKDYNSKEEWDAHVKEEELKEKQRLKEEEIRKVEAEKQQKIEALKEQERQKALALKMVTSNKMDSKLKTYDLGYINCDRFPNEPMIALSVDADEKLEAEYYLVYTDIRGVLKADVVGKMVNFNSVAQNRSAVLIAVCFVGKQAYYYKTSVASGGKLSNKIALAPVEESFLNQQLAALK